MLAMHFKRALDTFYISLAVYWSGTTPWSFFVESTKDLGAEPHDPRRMDMLIALYFPALQPLLASVMEYRDYLNKTYLPKPQDPGTTSNDRTKGAALFNEHDELSNRFDTLLKAVAGAP